MINATIIGGVWTLCFVILTLTIQENKSKYRLVWAIAAVLIVSLDLLWANWNLLPGISPSFFKESSFSVISDSEPSKFSRIYISAEDEYDIKFRRFFLFSDFKIKEGSLALRNSLLPQY